MPIQDLITTEQPLGLENQIKALPTSPISAPSAIPQQQAVTPEPLSKEVMNSIFTNASKSATKDKNPYETKFQDAALSERYEGRQVYYGDYKLDPKLLDTRYSKTQSWAEQSLNNLKVGLANGGATFAVGMIALPDVIRNIATGTPLTESAATKALYDFKDGVAQNNVNFQNEIDQDRSAWGVIKNTLLPSFATGSTTGWGSIFENMMYGVGGISAALVQEGIVSFIAPGVGNSAVLGANVAKLINNVNNLRKYGSLAEKIIETSFKLGSAVKTLNQGNKLVDGAKWAYRASIGSYGEAAFEAEEAGHSLKQSLTQQYRDKNGYDPTGEDLSNIDNLVKEGKGVRFWSNMALLMASNSFQYKRLFRNLDLSKDTVEQLAKQGLKLEVDEFGKPIAKKAFELKSDWWNKGFQKYAKKPVEFLGASGGGDFLLEAGSEGVEEFSQGWIDKAVNSYFTWKLDHRGQPAINQALKSVAEGFEESWNVDGLQSFLAGAVGGIAQQALFSLPNAPKQMKMKEARLSALNETLADYKDFDINDFFKHTNVNSVRGSSTSKAEQLNANGVKDAVADIATEQNDKKVYKDLESLNFFQLADPYVSKGHSQILKDQFAYSLENMSDDQVKAVFNNENITAEEAKNLFNNRVDDINQSYSDIKQAFRNPYTPAQPQYAVFEQFISELSYLDYRVKDLKSRKDDIQSDLGPYYEEFKYFGADSDLVKGKSYVQSEIARLKEDREYIKSIRATKELSAEFNKSRYLVDTYEQSLKELEEFESNPTQENYEKFLDTYHEAFVSKLERDNRGFFNKDEVMSKITDFGRITGDLDSVGKLLKSYYSPKGEGLFTATFEAAAKREQRKRDLYNINQKLVEKRDDFKAAYPDVTEEELDEILLESANEAQAKSKLDKLVKQKEKDALKIEKIKDKIREKFIKADRADLVEDFFNETTITPTNEKAVIEEANNYIKTLNNKDFSDFKQGVHNEFIIKIQKLNSGFNSTGLLEEAINAQAYNTLNRNDKIKYHNSLIDYYTALKGYKGLPKSYVQKQNKLIAQQKSDIKSIPEEKEVFSEQIGNYTIVKEGNNYHLSYKDKFIDTFKSSALAREYIENEIREKQMQKDVKAENVNNIENKFENGYFDPQAFDENGELIVSEEQAFKNRSIKAGLYNKIARDRNEEDVSQMISENLVIDKYSVEDLNQPDDERSGQLPQERILKSLTTDTIVINYQDEELGKVPLQTFKNYKTGLGFVSEKLLREELGARIKSSIDEIVKFIGKDNYYEFLKKSLGNDKVFKTLQDNGFLLFKGTIQEQINRIEEKQQIWDKLNNDSIENIKNDVVFEREFTSIGYKNAGNYLITDITYPFALLKDKKGVAHNTYTFFHIGETNMKDIDSSKFDFVGLPNQFKKEATEKIVQGFTNRYEQDDIIYNGYYTLFTDSSGNPAIYRLKNRELSSQEFFELTKQGITFKEVMVVVNQSNLDVSFTPKDENIVQINIGDKSDDSVMSFPYTIKEEKDVDGLVTEIYKQLARPQKWLGLEDKKSVRTDSLTIELVAKSEFKPSSMEEILSTRLVTGVSPSNYLVNKIVPRLKDTVKTSISVPPAPKKAKTPSSPIVNTGKKVGSQAIAKSLGLTIPNTITYDQIDELINNLSNLQSTPEQLATAIIFATNVRMQIEESVIYLNDFGNINLGVLDLISQQEFSTISNTFRKSDVANLTTTAPPYKTRVKDINDRVQYLLKNCFK